MTPDLLPEGFGHDGPDPTIEPDDQSIPDPEVPAMPETSLSDQLYDYLLGADTPIPTSRILHVFSDRPAGSVRTTLHNLRGQGRLVAYQQLDGRENMWKAVLPRPQGRPCTHPVTYRTDAGHQCVHCGVEVSVRVKS